MVSKVNRYNLTGTNSVTALSWQLSKVVWPGDKNVHQISINCI